MSFWNSQSTIRSQKSHWWGENIRIKRNRDSQRSPYYKSTLASFEIENKLMKAWCKIFLSPLSTELDPQTTLPVGVFNPTELARMAVRVHRVSQLLHLWSEIRCIGYTFQEILKAFDWGILIVRSLLGLPLIIETLCKSWGSKLKSLLVPLLSSENWYGLLIKISLLKHIYEKLINNKSTLEDSVPVRGDRSEPPVFYWEFAEPRISQILINAILSFSLLITEKTLPIKLSILWWRI